MSVVPHRQPTVPPATGEQPRWITLLGEAAQLARMIANTDFVPATVRGNEAEIAATILYGDEVGLPPMQALAKIAVINGKPTLSAEAQRALIHAAGHSIRGEGTTTKFTWTGRRGDTGDTMEFTWTLDDAKRAGIVGKQPWRQYPRAMLSARASAELARALFSDVIGGLAATEEFEDATEPPPTAAPEQPAEEKPTTRRRRRTTQPTVAPAIPTSPDEPPAPPIPDGPDSPGGQPMNEQQRKRLMALFREHGLTDRDKRLDWTNQHLDRTVVSASELTDIEASQLIQILQQEAAQAPPEDTQQGQAVAAEQPASAPPAAESQGARGPAAPSGQQTLGQTEETIGPDALDHLTWLRREANVDDRWLRIQLVELGVKDPPQNITREVLKQLTRTQANRLKRALSNEIDQRNDD